MLLKTKLLGEVYEFKSVKDVLAKAGEEKSGDILVGIAAGSVKERLAAKIVLGNMLISDLRNNPIVPYEEDEVTRIIQDDLNEKIYESIKNWSISELREFLLNNKTTDDEMRRVMRGLSAETIAAVSKIMGNMDLIYAARRIRNVTHCNTTMGERNVLATRLQPNHPGDDPEGIRFAIYEGLSYGMGDAVIGINPATTSVDSAVRLLNMLNEVKDKFEIPTQICYLVHLSTVLDALKHGATTDLIFASIGGSEAMNTSFGVGEEILEGARQQLLKEGTATGPNVMYFETGQGPESVANMHYGADSVTMEARTYGFGKHFSPFIVNTVEGFIGPEVVYDYKQVLRAMLEDHFMAKLSGLPIGVDIAFSSHVKGDYDDQDTIMTMLTLAETNYWVAVHGGADPTTYNMDSSYQDIVTLRELFGMHTVPAFEKWCQKWGILDEKGALTDIAGDPSIFI